MVTPHFNWALALPLVAFLWLWDVDFGARKGKPFICFQLSLSSASLQCQQPFHSRGSHHRMLSPAPTQQTLPSHLSPGNS